ncbi:MAG: hypothetical protein IKL81_04015 [Clostridia bacterium]|nr:hypothetical protein [Clostridia bacterium]
MPTTKDIRKVKTKMFNSKKFISIIIAVIMMFALSTAVFAAETAVEGEETDASVIMATGEDVDNTAAADEEQETVAETADAHEGHDHEEETADEHEGHDHEEETTTENKIVVSDTSNIIGIVVAIVLPIAAIVVIIVLVPKKNAPKKK